MFGGQIWSKKQCSIRYVGWIVCRWSKRPADSTRLSDLLNFYMMNMNMMKVLPKSNIWERWIINKIYLISQLLLLKCSEIEWRADWHFFYEKELNNVSSKESQTAQICQHTKIRWTQIFCIYSPKLFQLCHPHQLDIYIFLRVNMTKTAMKQIRVIFYLYFKYFHKMYYLFI